MDNTVCIVGGAGFIGSHLTAELLARQVESVRVFDNFSSGTRAHLSRVLGDERLEIIEGEASDVDALIAAFRGCDLVVHLASNPDIARAATEPDIDFREGTRLTHSVMEAMRMSGVRRIVYASGSGVYGDLGDHVIAEDHGPLRPISTYGASKLAGEALLSAYAHMFDIQGFVFRFANVVGPRQTHGVAFDFIRRLHLAPGDLRVLGNGYQSKSYVHVSDLLAAVLMAVDSVTAKYSCFNISTPDYVTVREIAEIVIKELGLTGTAVHYMDADRGWKGDVPVVRLATDRIAALGWNPKMSSREAIVASVTEQIKEFVC